MWHFQQKIRKIFWGGGTAPETLPQWGGGPTPHPPRRLQHLDPPILKSWVRH